MQNFSMFIKGVHVSSEIEEEIVELLPRATYVSVFAKDPAELTAELIDSVISFGFVTDGVIGLSKVANGALSKNGEPKTASSFVNFKRPTITGASLLRTRARKAAKPTL